MAPVIIGHRGARGERPENTLEGFRHAARLSIPIETDIAMTADFVPVIHHDPALADGRLIRDLPYAALSDIPTLGQALAALPDQKWLLEIKTYPVTPEKSHPPALMVAGVLGSVRDTNSSLSNIAIKAFAWEVLRETARQSPTIHRIALTAPDTEAARESWWGGGFDELSTPEAVAKAGAQTWSAFHETLTTDHILRARSMGLRVFAWTVNDKQSFDHLAPLVDGLVTDVPTRLLQWNRAGP
jgi:glycerophosphoryl diester phosphodiesterase